MCMAGECYLLYADLMSALEALLCFDMDTHWLIRLLTHCPFWPDRYGWCCRAHVPRLFFLSIAYL